ncbi:right-handed parallel beta-helix repeat-containing protein [Deinococcus aquaticus]|uniref:right-handed parallel beta-helix repeat-containing protein n=1 Tax=Deinococcus aquaticus TaxID=328692 RepID=UPI003F45527C
MTHPPTAGDRVAERYSVQFLLRESPHERLYRAVTDWGESVLLTVFDPPHADSPTGARVRQAFMRHARLMAQVQHPAAPRVMDLHDTPARQVVVVQDRLHRTLRSLTQVRPLQPGTAQELAVTLFQALAAAHTQALLHARLSPDSVWFDAQGQVLLGDFALAARALQELRQGAEPDPRYAAPELLAGAAFSPQSDVYALAATLHEAVSGVSCPPALARAQGVPLPSLPAATPAALRTALVDALQLDAAQRCVSASEVLELLTRAAPAEPERASPAQQPIPPEPAAPSAPLGGAGTSAPHSTVIRPTPARRNYTPLIAGLVVTALLLGAALRMAVPSGPSGRAVAAASESSSSRQTTDTSMVGATPAAAALPGTPASASPETGSDVTAPVPARTVNVVNTTVLNVRASPGSTGTVITTLARGDSVAVLEDQGEWLRVMGIAGGQSGWVKASLTLPLRSDDETRALVAALESGQDIVLPGGAYRLERPVTISGPLTLTGAGMKATVLFSAAPEDTLILSQASVSISDLSVAHVGTLPARSIRQDGGQLTLDRVLIAGAVRDDDLSEYGSGLWVQEQAEATVSASTFTGNTFGVYVSDSSRADVTTSTFSANRDGGLLFRDASTGTVNGNTVEATGAHGIHVAGQATPSVTFNRIRGNRGRGVTVYGQASPILSGNTIEDNTLQGVGVQDSAAPTLEGNTIQGNRQSGVTYFDNSGGEASGNTVQGNRTAGFRMMNYAQPTLDSNTIDRNRENGLAYSEYAAGQARNNTITGSGNPGIASWGDAQPELTGNTVTGGKQSGVVLAERSAGTLSGNQINGNALYGLIVTGSAAPQVTENTLTGNGSGGIFYKQNAAGSGYGNTCYDNRGPNLSADLNPDGSGPEFDQDGCSLY